MATRSVVTLAFGKEYYLGLAVSLARSFRLWHPEGAIGFVIVSDIDAPLPADLAWVEIRRVAKGAYDSGFGSKLHLDAFGQADANVFIDADCLVFGRLGPLFERWHGRPFALVGETVSGGEFFGDVASRCQLFGVPAVPRLVGSVYYWEKGEASSKLFESARAITAQYDEFGFVRLRGMPNEEPVISVAFAQAGLLAEADDGSVKADAMSFGRIERCDVTRGRPLLTNDPSAAFPTWTRLGRAEPVILHFNDSYSQRPPYLREVLRLKLLARLPAFAAGPVSWTIATLPHVIVGAAKSLLRPVYSRVYGRRPVKSSPRV